MTPGAAEQGGREQGRRTVIFDLGGVVLSWDPVLAFNAVVDTDAAQRLMRDVDFSAWNRRNDAGRRYAEGEAEVADTWPEYAEAITAYRRHFDRTLTGTVPGTSAVVAELARAGVRLLGLTNWSDETFPVAQRRFGILRRLEAIVVSGREGLAKPDPRLYRLLLDRYAVDAASAVFVDDNEANCVSGRRAGPDGHPVRRRRRPAGAAGRPGSAGTPCTGARDDPAHRRAPALGRGG